MKPIRCFSPVICAPGIVFLYLCLLPVSAVSQNARIKIDIEREIDKIDPLIYGNFTEHLGRCIYGGIYDPESPLADEHGFRKDVAMAAKDLNATFSTDQDKDNPYLDVSAAYDPNTKELVVNVVNRNKDQAFSTDIQSQFGGFSGKARISEVNGNDIKDVNDLQSQRVKTVTREIPVKGVTFTYAFPAHSFTQIAVKLE